jgi:hypothetical protein
VLIALALSTAANASDAQSRTCYDPGRRPGHLVGERQHRTPYIDVLAKEGMRFETALRPRSAKAARRPTATGTGNRVNGTERFALTAAL